MPHVYYNHDFVYPLIQRIFTLYKLAANPFCRIYRNCLLMGATASEWGTELSNHPISWPPSARGAYAINRYGPQPCFPAYPSPTPAPPDPLDPSARATHLEQFFRRTFMFTFIFSHCTRDDVDVNILVTGVPALFRPGPFLAVPVFVSAISVAHVLRRVFICNEFCIIRAFVSLLLSRFAFPGLPADPVLCFWLVRPPAPSGILIFEPKSVGDGDIWCVCMPPDIFRAAVKRVSRIKPYKLLLKYSTGLA